MPRYGDAAVSPSDARKDIMVVVPNLKTEAIDMAGLPKRPCRHQGCAEYALDGKRFCARHHAEHENKRKRESRARNGRPEWDAMYRDGRWYSLRARKLRQQPLCEDCLEYGVAREATDVDHDVAHRGNPALFYDIENLRSLCHECHSSKTAKKDGGFGNKVDDGGEEAREKKAAMSARERLPLR